MLHTNLTMKGAELFEILRDTGGYTTRPGRPARAVDRLLGRWDGWCHLRVIAVVCAANRYVKRHGYPDERWADDACGMLDAYESCGARVRVEDFARVLHNEQPRVYVASHMSSIETMLLPGMLLPLRHVTVVVKESLARYPLFGPVIRGTGAITVGRTNPREDLKTVLAEGAAALARGDAVLLFPQSTRREDFAPAAFNSLGAKLAARAGCPLLPVALRSDFIGVGRLVRDFGPLRRDRPVCIRFGKDITVPRGGAREAHTQGVRFISETLRKWGVKVSANGDT